MASEALEPQDPNNLAREAARCRRLADAVSDSRTVRTLRLMAQDYEQRARQLKPERA